MALTEGKHCIDKVFRYAKDLNSSLAAGLPLKAYYKGPR